MSIIWQCRRLAGALFLLVLAGPAFSQEAGWNLYSGYSTTYTIRYAQPSDLEGPSAGLFVKASINGLPASSFQLDTGSQGMVVPQYMVPGFQQSSNLQKVIYGSSQNYGLGTWSVQTIAFPDSDDGHGNLATAQVPIFVTALYFDEANPQGISCATQGAACAYMIGIGFGRPDAGWGPDVLPSLNTNPLLHLPGMDEGTVRAGYVITPDYVQAGLTSANAGTGFAYVQLQPATAPTAPNWQTPQGSIVVNGSSSDSPILLDAGIRYMWADLGSEVASQAVACPAGTPSSFRCAPAGTQVSVYFGGTQAVGYSFVVDGTGNPPAAPEFTRLNSSGVNTGVHVLASFTYMFDAVGGFAGYAASAAGTPGVYFTPYLSAMGDFILPTSFGTNLPVYIAGDAVFSTASTATFSGAFSGTKGLTLEGPGTFTFKADMTLPAGIALTSGSATLEATVTAPLTVSPSATLFNQGSIIGAVTNAGLFSNDGKVTGDVSNAGLLIGDGTIAGKLVTSGGVSPGHSIGTTTIAGDVAFQPGSYYMAEFGAAGSSDLLVAGGQVRIDGATLYVVPLASWTPGLGSYQVIDAAGGITGSFTVVAPGFATAGGPLPFLDVATSTDGGGLQVDVVRSAVSYASIASTPNGIATAQALDSPAVALNGNLIVLNAQEARQAFDQLSGEVHASAQSVFMEQSSLIRGALVDRLRAAQSGVGASAGTVVNVVETSSGALAYAAPSSVQVAADLSLPVKAAPVLAPVERFSLWTTGFGNWGSFDGNANASGINDSTGGFLIGADTLVGSGWRIGVAGGYSYSDFSSAGRNASGSSDNWHAGIYAGNVWGQLALRTGLSYTWQDVSTSRNVAFTGFFDSLSADYDTGTFQAFGELGWRIDTAFASFEPFANLAYVSLDTSGYVEQGGAAALFSDGSDMDTTFSTLGLRASKEIALGSYEATLRGMLGWRHAFGDITPSITQAFLTSDAFTVTGVPIAEDAAVIEAGLDLRVGEATTLGIAYTGQFGGGVTQNGFNAILKVSF